MPRAGARRGRKKRFYEIVVASAGEGKNPFSFRVSRLRIVLALALFFLLSVVVTIGVLMYTPIAMYVPIPNPALEARYGHQIVETQEHLNKLAEDVLTLRDYNQQLRKALGEGSTPDSGRSLPPSVAIEPGQQQMKDTRADQAAMSMDEGIEPSPESGVPTTFAVASSSAPSSLPLLQPTEGYESQGFDPSRNHLGVDIAGKRGTPVFAASDGRVVFAGWTPDDGNMLIVAHAGGYLTVYKHNQTLLCNLEVAVKRGQTIALLGSSGKTSLGPHLHFEVWKDGQPHDPHEYLLTTPRIQ